MWMVDVAVLESLEVMLVALSRSVTVILRTRSERLVVFVLLKVIAFSPAS